MTTPLIVITVEGGVIQDISASRQARVVIVDRDARDYEPEYHRSVGGRLAAVVDHGTILPSPGADDWLKEVLLCLT